MHAAFYHLITHYINSFVHTATSGISKSIQQYGPKEVVPPIWMKAIAIGIILVRLLPSFIVEYTVLKKFVGWITRSRKGKPGIVAFALTVLLNEAHTVIFAYYLHAGVKPKAEYSGLTTGPFKLIGTIQYLIVNNPAKVFSLLSSIAAFIAISWICFFVFNYTLKWITWGGFRRNPLFSKTSPASGATFFTIIWIVYVSIAPPTTALIDTGIVVITMLYQRSEMPQRVVHKVQKPVEKTQESNEPDK